MAVFESMRENTKVILWITVVAFIGLIFLAWGADFSTKGGSRRGEQGVLAKINGEKVMVRDFSDAIVQARVIYEQQTGQRPDDSIELMLTSRTWDNLVDRALIRQEVRDCKIRVTDREVAIALINNPPPRFRINPAFQTEGAFDIQKYQGWLADPRTNTIPLEAEQREMVAFEKLQLQMLCGVKVSAQEVRQSWLDQNAKIELAYIKVPYTSIKTEEADYAALEAYLHEHPDDFSHPDRVALQYVRIDKTISFEDSSDAQMEINEAYTELKRGEDFGILVKAFSFAPPSRLGGEEATFLTKVQISQKEVAEAAFSLPIGEVSEVIASSDGFHLIKVEERITEDDVEKVKIADIFIPLKMSTQTNANLRERMADMADSAHVHGFASMAEKMDLTIHNTGLFDPQGFIRGLANVAAAKDFALRAKPGEISKPVQTKDTWYLFFLDERRPPQPASLDEVRLRVLNACMLEKRKEIAEQRAVAILELCRQGMSLEEAAAQESLAIHGIAAEATSLGFLRGLGSEPQLTGAAFALGEIGLVPYVVSGNQGAFVVETLSLPEIDEAAFAEAKEQARMGLLQEKQNRLLGTWMNDLRRSAKIEDYRLSVASM
ncbi:MAG: SurA N-terminal domain-containing protein [Candidatus Eisenbacteria sp.]|nr:SurA N-terminal domain-containing protein [Candidatus Eisenbacteria bacterium]